MHVSDIAQFDLELDLELDNMTGWSTEGGVSAISSSSPGKGSSASSISVTWGSTIRPWRVIMLANEVRNGGRVFDSVLRT